MNIIRDIVEGETDPFILPLEEDGVALNGTGFTVTDLLITGTEGTAVDTTSKFAWAVQASGTITVSPAAGDFDAMKSPYKVRVLLTDGSGKTRYYPNGEAVGITVRKAR
jgi:hypothetical protein